MWKNKGFEVRQNWIWMYILLFANYMILEQNAWFLCFTIPSIKLDILVPIIGAVMSDGVCKNFILYQSTD